MNEFFADTIELWSFDFLNNKFHLLIHNSQNQFWREFFKDLENGETLEAARHSILTKIVKTKFSDFDSSKIDSIWEKFPNYFEGNIKSNLDKLSNDPNFQSALREITINKIID